MSVPTIPEARKRYAKYAAILGGVGLLLMVAALVGPWWELSVGGGPLGIPTEGRLELGLAGISVVVETPFGAVTDFIGYSTRPNLGGMFATLTSIAMLAFLFGIPMLVLSAVSRHRPRLARPAGALGILTFILVVVMLLHITTSLPAAFNSDSASGIGGADPEISTFWGSETVIQTGAAWQATWGAGWSWYVLLLASFLWLAGGVSALAVRARKEVAVPGVPELEPGRALTRRSFVAGATGHFLAVAGTLIYGGAVTTGLFTSTLSFVVLALAGSFFAITLLVQLPGFWGFWRSYRSRVSLASFVYGLVAVLLFLLAHAILVLPFPLALSFQGSLFLLSLLAVGVLFILEGVAFIRVRHLTRSPGLSLATGILFIIAGSMILPVFTILFGAFFILLVPMITGGITLARISPRPAPFGVEATGPTAGPAHASTSPNPGVSLMAGTEAGQPGTAAGGAEGIMRDITTKIDDLERAIEDQETFMMTLEERLVDGAIDEEIYGQIRQNRTDHLTYLKQELEQARSQLPGAKDGTEP